MTAPVTIRSGCLRSATGSCENRAGPAGDPAATEGLIALIALFLEQGRLLAEAPAALKSYTSAAFTFVWRAGLSDMLGGTSLAETLYVEAAHESALFLIPVHGGLMAATIIVIVGAIFVQYRPMVRRLRDETRRTHHMLQLIPDEILDKVDCIRAYVDRHMSELGD
eukprot:tig00000441_g701.t1